MSREAINRKAFGFSNPGALAALIAWGVIATHSVHAAPTASAYASLAPADFAKVRAEFYKAAESLDATTKAIAAMDTMFSGEISTWPGIVRAYRASLEGLIGKHDASLTVKLTRVNKAIEMFDGLVENWPDSLELRFLRYSFYSQLPGIFGVGKYIKPDLEALLAMYERGGDGTVPVKQLLDMAEWLRTEGKLSKSEQARLAMAVGHLR
jgi:hypothetical protein